MSDSRGSRGQEDKLEEGRQGRGEPAGARALRDGRHRRQEAERGTRRLISAGAAKSNVTGATGENGASWETVATVGKWQGLLEGLV